MEESVELDALCSASTIGANTSSGNSGKTKYRSNESYLSLCITHIYYHYHDYASPSLFIQFLTQDIY